MSSLKKDPRHLKRRNAVKSLFAHSFNEFAQRKSARPMYLLAKRTIARIEEVNKIITQAAPKWPLEKINRIDLSILQLAVWELLHRPKVPPKVVINEAIELAKEFGGEGSPGFVNGVLGTVYKDFVGEKSETEEDKNAGNTPRKTED